MDEPIIPPYISVEVTKTTKGYTWSAKAGHYPDPQSAVEAMGQAEAKLRDLYGGYREE